MNIIPIIKSGNNVNVALLPFLNKNIGVNNLKNKTIFLNWIQGSSPAGKKSIADFNNLYEKLGLDPNIVFISVGSNKNFLNKGGNYYLLKADSSASSLLGEFYPLNLIINPSGTVVYSRVGYNKTFSKSIEEILSKYKQK